MRFVIGALRRPALIEEFIDGREFTVPILEVDRKLTTLPIVEVLFENLPAGCPHIYTHEAKWLEESPESNGTSLECPANVEPDLEERTKQAALAAARAVEMRDYGRIDIRVRRHDNAVFVHDVNPNCAFTAGSAYVFSTESTGRTYRDIVREVVQSTIGRYAS